MSLQFQLGWDRLQQETYETAVKNGFHEIDQKMTDPEQVRAMFGLRVALIHSELSEALESYRKNGPEAPSEHGLDCSALEEELADVVIRIMDLAASHDLDVSMAVVQKAEFNKTRPYKHGKKF